MDNKKKNPNPLLNPPDNLLRAVLLLETVHSFGEIKKWLEQALAYFRDRLPYGKDEVDHRWDQGAVQALSLIIAAFSDARKELESRDRNSKENQVPRNV